MRTSLLVPALLFLPFHTLAKGKETTGLPISTSLEVGTQNALVFFGPTFRAKLEMLSTLYLCVLNHGDRRGSLTEAVRANPRRLHCTILTSGLRKAILRTIEGNTKAKFDFL